MMKKKSICIALLFFLLTFGFSVSSFAIHLTSITLEKAVCETGAWTNAPGGIWSTNLGDPLTQLGVSQDGIFLNNPGNNLDLGEISIELQPGINTFDMFGTSYYGDWPCYGVALFFDGIATPPQIAVYNDSGGNIDAFSVIQEGTTISGSANGGLFPDTAPGSGYYLAPDGSSVEVIGFTATFSSSSPDLVSWGNIETDGYLDVVAQLVLKYTPPCNNYLNELINIVQSMNIQNGILNSLDAKLSNAKNALEDAKNNDKPNAINKLDAFKKEVVAQSGKMISEEQAALLTDKANMIILCLNEL